jgi:hypothetical protein
MNFRNVSLKIAVCLLILCLGFTLGSWSHTARHQIDNSHWNYVACRPLDGIHQHVFVFDTEQKIADHYKAMAARHRPECSFVRQIMARAGRDQPLVTAGPFTIFVNNDTDEFSVHESTSPLPLVELSRIGQTKFLRLHGLLEEGWTLPRFGGILTYSVDGVYRGYNMSLRGDSGTLTSYTDSKGIGVFDTMSVVENGVRVTYRLNGLTWEPLEVPLPPGLGGQGLLPPPMPPPGSSFIP